MKKLKKFWYWLEYIPDHLYPFKTEIEGQFVRGLRAYQANMERAFEKFGPHKIGYKLNLYRGIWHVFGSILVIIAATEISKRIFGTETALYLMLAVVAVVLFFQEFYSHPRRYHQSRTKSFTDWFTWVTPIALYLIFWS